MLKHGQVMAGRESGKEMVWLNGTNGDSDRGKFCC